MREEEKCISVSKHGPTRPKRHLHRLFVFRRNEDEPTLNRDQKKVNFGNGREDKS